MKRKNKYYSEYRKVRRNLQQQYRRMKKAGYEFEKSPVPAIPKKITQGSIRRIIKEHEKLKTRRKTEKPTLKPIEPANIPYRTHEPEYAEPKKPEELTSLPEITWIDGVFSVYFEDWESYTGSFRYENCHWAFTDIIDLNEGIKNGVTGIDNRTVYDYMKELSNEGEYEQYNIIFDPEEIGDVVFYDLNKWEEYKRELENPKIIEYDDENNYRRFWGD